MGSLICKTCIYICHVGVYRDALDLRRLPRNRELNGDLVSKARHIQRFGFRPWTDMGFPKIRGTFFGGPHNKDYKGHQFGVYSGYVGVIEGLRFRVSQN